MANPIDKQKLRAIAQAATPGPWRQGVIEKHHIFVETPAGEWMGHERVLLRMNTYFPHDADAAFIAAASPSTVISLLDENDRLRKLALEACDIAQSAIANLDAEHDEGLASNAFNAARRLAAIEKELNGE